MTAILTPASGAPAPSPRDHGEVLSSDSDAAAYCGDHHVRLYQLAVHGWLVRATGTDVAPGIVLGCVEEREGRFELMQIGGGFRWTVFDTLLHALMHLMTAEGTLDGATVTR